MTNVPGNPTLLLEEEELNDGLTEVEAGMTWDEFIIVATGKEQIKRDKRRKRKRKKRVRRCNSKLGEAPHEDPRLTSNCEDYLVRRANRGFWRDQKNMAKIYSKKS